MSKINSEYIHHIRTNTITADKARSALVDFELRGTDITDPDEKKLLVAEHREKAFSVIFAAIENNNLKYTADGPFRDVDRHGNTVGLKFDAINLKFDEFCSWASKLKYNLPEELAVLAKDFGCNEAQSAEDHNQNTTKPNGKIKSVTDKEDTKVIDGLLKIVIAIAIDCYGYDPKDKKSPTTADIRDALHKCGLSLSENTIRTRLKEAAELLPGEEKTQ